MQEDFYNMQIYSNLSNQSVWLCRIGKEVKNVTDAKTGGNEGSLLWTWPFPIKKKDDSLCYFENCGMGEADQLFIPLK